MAAVSFNKILVVILIFGFCDAVPKYENVNTYPENKWRRAYYNEKQNETVAESSNDRLQRLGYTTGYGGISGYPQSGSGIASYNPVKIELGGVLLGTLVGIGAVLIIPKLLGVFSGAYGGHYARSSDGELTAIANMLSKVDEVLGQNNIDSTNCMQRAVCSYVRSTESNIKTGSADQVDELIHTLSENSLVDYMLDGTAIKEALEHGRNVEEKECDKIYSACPLDSNSIANILSKLMPKSSQ